MESWTVDQGGFFFHYFLVTKILRLKMNYHIETCFVFPPLFYLVWKGQLVVIFVKQYLPAAVCKFLNDDVHWGNTMT